MRNFLISSILICSINGCVNKQNVERDYMDIELSLSQELNIEVLGEIKIKSLKSDEVTMLKNLRSVKGENILFFFSDFHCISCINQELNLIDRTARSKIVLLANFQSTRELKILLRNVKNNTFIPTSNLPKELIKLSDPFYLRFYEDKKLIDVMIPVLGDTQKLDRFLNKIIY